jgi:hypothetical protein
MPAPAPIPVPVVVVAPPAVVVPPEPAVLLEDAALSPEELLEEARRLRQEIAASEKKKLAPPPQKPTREAPGILPEQRMDMPKDETIRNLVLSVVTKAPREPKNVMEKQDDSFRNLVVSFCTSIALVASLPFILPKIEEGTLYTDLVPEPIRARLAQQYTPVQATGKIATSTTPLKALEVKKKAPASSSSSSSSSAKSTAPPVAPETAAEVTQDPVPFPNSVAPPASPATDVLGAEEEAAPKELTKEELQKEEARQEELRRQEARIEAAHQWEEAQKEEARQLEAATRLRQAVPTVAAIAPEPTPAESSVLKAKPITRAPGQEEFQTFEDIMKRQAQK